MKVSPALEDNFIPMFAEDEKALQEAKRKRNEHWARMRNAREYWMTKHKLKTLDDNFWLWLRDDYGMIPHRDSAGLLTSNVDIVDEKLYLLFLLKFSQ